MKIVFLFFVFFFGHVFTNVYNTNWKRLTHEALKKDVNLLKKSINKTELHKAIANIKKTISYVKAGVLKNITSIKGCLSGNTLMCNEKHKHDTSYTDLQEIIRNINRETLQKTNETILLGKQRKMEIVKLYQLYRIINAKLTKISVNDMIDLQQKLVACRMLSSGTAEMTVDLVNTTVMSLEDVLRKAGGDIRNLTRTFLFMVTSLADLSTVHVQNLVIMGETAKNHYIQSKEVETISLISELSIKRLNDYYNLLEKEIMDLAKTGSNQILEMASNQTDIIETFKSKFPKLNRYIKFATSKIKNAVKHSSEKYKELASNGLKGLRQLTDSCLKSFKEYVSLAVQYIENGEGQEYKEKMQQYILKFDDVKQVEFDKVIDSVQKSTSSVLEDSIENNAAIKHL